MQQEAVTQFKGQLRAELIEPADSRYEEARKVYNAMISRKPPLIARCADVADVITAVHFGWQHGLRVSIRSGGHDAGGLGERFGKGTTGRSWQGFDPKGVHFIGLNNSAQLEGMGAIGDAQMAWLKNDSRQAGGQHSYRGLIPQPMPGSAAGPRKSFAKCLASPMSISWPDRIAGQWSIRFWAPRRPASGKQERAGLICSTTGQI